MTEANRNEIQRREAAARRMLAKKKKDRDQKSSFNNFTAFAEGVWAKIKMKASAAK